MTFEITIGDVIVIFRNTTPHVNQKKSYQSECVKSPDSYEKKVKKKKKKYDLSNQSTPQSEILLTF